MRESEKRERERDRDRERQRVNDCVSSMVVNSRLSVNQIWVSIDGHFIIITVFDDDKCLKSETFKKRVIIRKMREFQRR